MPRSPDHLRPITRAVADALAPAGFRERGATFQRWHPEVVHLVALRRSPSSDRDTLKLGVELAVWVLSLAPIRRGIPDRPSLARAHWRQSLAALAHGHDAWWYVRDAQEASSCARDIVDALTSVALPALNRLASASHLLALWRSGSSPGLTPGERRMFMATLATQA